MKKNHDTFHFRGQMENEIVKDFYRHHWIILLPSFFSLFFFLALIITLSVNLQYLVLPPFTVPVFEVLVIMVMVGSGFLIHKFFMNLLEYFMNVVIITNNMVIIIKKSLFLHDDKESIYMKEIQDIQKQQYGIVKNLLQYGDLLINVGVPELTILRLVPNPNYHFRLLSMVRNEGYVRDDKRRDHQSLAVPMVDKQNNTVENEVLRKEDVSL